MRESTTKVRKSVELIQEDEDWLQTEFPGLSPSWIHQKLVEAFRSSWEAEGKGMQHYIELGAKEMKNLLLTSGENEDG